MTVEVEAETHPLDTLRRLADYVLGSDVQEDADRDQVMSSIWGDLQVVIDRIKDTCFCAWDQPTYCHAPRCHGGLDLKIRKCNECTVDEDPAPWCDCADTQCKGPCRKRAHDPSRCPGEWKDTTWRHILADDEVLGSDELPWKVVMGFSLTNTRSVTVVNAQGKDFTFYPAHDQPVKARRGSHARAVEILQTRFTVEAITNGSKK